MAKKKATNGKTRDGNGANIGYEAGLSQMADTLRGGIGADNKSVPFVSSGVWRR